MNTKTRETLSKVPEVTLVFWVIKILATTLGETGGMGKKNQTRQRRNPSAKLWSSDKERVSDSR
jgi:hypothetical protein